MSTVTGPGIPNKKLRGSAAPREVKKHHTPNRYEVFTEEYMKLKINIIFWVAVFMFPLWSSVYAFDIRETPIDGLPSPEHFRSEYEDSIFLAVSPDGKRQCAAWKAVKRTRKATTRLRKALRV